MEEKSIKVNCSFCGKEIPCPDDMRKSEKHACFDCFQKLSKDHQGESLDKIHVAIPKDKMDKMMPEMLLNSLMQGFPQFWSENKSEIKELSKRKLAEEMFAAGASAMTDLVMQMNKEAEKEKNQT